MCIKYIFFTVFPLSSPSAHSAICCLFFLFGGNAPAIYYCDIIYNYTIESTTYPVSLSSGSQTLISPQKTSLSHRLTPGASHTHGTPFHVWVRLSWDRSVQLLGSELQPWVRVLLGPSWSLRLWSSVPIGGPPVTQSQQLKIICLNFWWVMIFDPC